MTFVQTREAFVERVLGAVRNPHQAIFHLLNDYGTFGWQYEAGNTNHPWRMRGDLEFGIAYIRHMIDQGFYVGFCMNHARSEVWLKCWEYGQIEPPWPESLSYDASGSSLNQT